MAKLVRKFAGRIKKVTRGWGISRGLGTPAAPFVPGPYFGDAYFGAEYFGKYF